MNSPLVSIVCLCHNHKRFVTEAIESVLHQTYSNWELIVIDDASTDGSQSVIEDLVARFPKVKYQSIKENVGNCTAFNDGLKHTNGELIIDLAADDVLLPDRIAKGVEAFGKMTSDYGVQFSDAKLIDESGKPLGHHSDRFPHALVPQGDIYVDLIKRYFICSPTMMFRRSVINDLNGYDETLAYEDFDFWIRSARKFKYFYISEAMVKRRVVAKSLSQRQFTRGNNQQRSTFEVCKKIMTLNRSEEERMALSERIRYEFIHCLRRGDFGLALDYFNLSRKNR